MAIHEIQNKYTGEVIVSEEAESLDEAVVSLVRKGVSLERADLREVTLAGRDLRKANLKRAALNNANLEYANLEGANLEGADLEGADLGMACLRGANLGYANLESARLCSANLRFADLVGAHLCNANLEGARLTCANLRETRLKGARLNWESHDLLAEIIRQAADYEVEKLKIAGLILIDREDCWDDFLSIRDPLKDWALGVLAIFARGDDNAPEVLRDLAAKIDRVSGIEPAPADLVLQAGGELQ